MTISRTDAMSLSSALRPEPFNVGQYASLVEATTPLYLEPTLEPERAMPPGKRQDDIRHCGDGFHGAFCCGECRLGAGAHDDDIAAADGGLAEAGRRAANKFAVHHRYAPVLFVPETLGDLPAVAEKAQRVAEL